MDSIDMQNNEIFNILATFVIIDQKNMKIINSVIRLFSILNTVSVMTPWQSLPPKLSLLSHTLIGDTVDVTANTSVHIKCTGEKPMIWLFPNNNPVNILSKF